MRVLINCLATAGTRTGIGHYTSQLVRCLREQAGEGVAASFPGPVLRQAGAAWGRVRTLLEPPLVPLFASRGELRKTRAAWRPRLLQSMRSAGQAFMRDRFRSFAQRGGFDLYHEPNFIPFSCDLPTVTTVHDLSVLLHPEWHPADRVAHFEKYFQPGLGRSRHFLAISETSRQEIIRHLGIAPERVTRTYMGIRPGLQPLPATAVRETLHTLGLPPRYLLYLGTLEPRKNVLTVLRAYCRLPESVRSSCPLLLVGGFGWKAGEVARYLENEARGRSVIHLGYLDDALLPAVYNGAQALVFPSFYEGFGLPPLEMLACGGAVIGSTAKAIAETVGGQAHLVDPHDLDGWHAALQRIMTDEEWRQELRRGAVAVAQRFTWDQCAADTLAIYRRVHDGNPAACGLAVARSHFGGGTPLVFNLRTNNLLSIVK